MTAVDIAAWDAGNYPLLACGLFYALRHKLRKIVRYHRYVIICHNFFT